MELKFKQKEKVLIVKVFGELDLHTADSLKEEVEEKINKNNRFNNLILDLNNMKFIDSSGLGAILSLYKKLNDNKGEIAVINLSPQVKRIFKLSGMLKLLLVAQTKEAAVKMIRRGGSYGE